MAHMSETVIDGLTVVDCNGVPMVRAIELGERLELTRPANIINLVRRQQKLGKLNDSDLLFVTKKRVDSLGVEQSYVDVYLSETGAVIVTLACRTKTAVAICRAVVAVFIAWRHGRLGAASDAQVAAAIAGVRGDVLALRGELAKSHDAVMLTNADTRDMLTRSHAMVMTAVGNAHVAMMTAQREMHEAQMKALREIWKADHAAHVKVLEALHAYGSLAGRVDWYERNAPVDGIISAKQHLEISRLARDIAEAESKAGLWKGSIPAARRDVYRELGEVVRWGSTEQKWRMLPAQRIGDARTCLARRYKTAIAMVRAAAAAATDSRQQDLFEWLARVDGAARKETKH